MARFIEEVYEPDDCYIRIVLDTNRIRLLKVHLIVVYRQYIVESTPGSSPCSLRLMLIALQHLSALLQN